MCLLLSATFAPILAQSCSESMTVVLVRHAEKAADQGSDPSLTEAGKQRAEALASVLHDFSADVFYASQYKRTQETLQPLATQQGKNITIKPIQGKLDDFANALKTEMLQDHCGKNVVIAGHSNTIPALIQAWCNQSAPIQDSEHHHLFVATLKNNNCSLIRASYGKM